MNRTLLCLVVVIATNTDLLGQTPQPFPRPTTAPPPSAPAPQPPPAQAPALEPPPPAQPAAPPADPDAPTEATLGLPIYPAAQFLTSYDAGRSQRYYIFGATTPYAELVTYYQTLLRERGDEVFKEPPTHMFEVGRFRNQTMAFPPGVTIKDWTWGGSPGYPNPKLDGQPERFPSIIMIVPAPPETDAGR